MEYLTWHCEQETEELKTCSIKIFGSYVLLRHQTSSSFINLVVQIIQYYRKFSNGYHKRDFCRVFLLGKEVLLKNKINPSLELRSQSGSSICMTKPILCMRRNIVLESAGLVICPSDCQYSWPVPLLSSCNTVCHHHINSYFWFPTPC